MDDSHIEMGALQPISITKALETGMGDATSERILGGLNIQLTSRYFEVYTQGTRVNCTIPASGSNSFETVLRIVGNHIFE